MTDCANQNPDIAAYCQKIGYTGAAPCWTKLVADYCAAFPNDCYMRMRSDGRGPDRLMPLFAPSEICPRGTDGTMKDLPSWADIAARMMSYNPGSGDSGSINIPQPQDVCVTAAQIGVTLPGCGPTGGTSAGTGTGTGTGSGGSTGGGGSGGGGGSDGNTGESFLTSTVGMVVIAGGLTALAVGAVILKGRKRRPAGVAGVRGKRRGKRSSYLSGIGCGGNIGCSAGRNLGCGCR